MFKFRVTEALWVPVLPTLPWHTRYPSSLPDEFSFAYPSSNRIAVICNQDSCLINIASFLASLSWNTSSWSLDISLLDISSLWLISMRVSYRLRLFSQFVTQLSFLLWSLLSDILFFFAPSTALAFFLMTVLQNYTKYSPILSSRMFIDSFFYKSKSSVHL